MKKKLGRCINPFLPQVLQTSPNRGDIEDAGVEGKRYPTNLLGRTLVRFPISMFLTILLPFIFFIIGCVRIQHDINYTLSDFRLSNSVATAAAASRYDSVVNSWSSTVAGADRLAMIIDARADRSRVLDIVELRVRFDPEEFQRYCTEYNVPPSRWHEMADLLYSDNVLFALSVESELRSSKEFKDVCFTNDLEYGMVNLGWPLPECVPPTSVAQYFYPRFNASETDVRRVWHMDGLGTTMQRNVLPRIFVNPNYGWFFDNEFSAANPRAVLLRSGYALAASPGESTSSYRQKANAFVKFAQQYLQMSVRHPYIHVMMGGDLAQNALIADVASAEGYKVAVAFVICFVLSCWHCGSFVMGLYAGAQVIFTYMAAVGMYAIIYKALPLMTYSAVIWVMTFGLHGTLSFYDMFVYTGVMATKGRQNNLSVPQRICFTIRRITVGVWLANILAIVIFAINQTSAFDSVRQFSVLMMIASLWNMYFIILPTPAWVCIHHYYFSDRRRDRQKQIDVLNMKAQECRRDRGSLIILSTIHSNLSKGEKGYSLDEDVVAARIGANRGINKKYYKNVADYLNKQISHGAHRGRLVGEEVVGAMHKLRKTKRKYLCCGESQVENNYGGPSNVRRPPPAEGGGGDPMYHNRRLVRYDNVIHIPRDVVERSEECWEVMCEAIKQRNPDGVQAPHVYTLQTTGESERDLRAFSVRWNRAAEALGLATNNPGSHDAAALLPAMTRTVVRAQDPSYVAGGRRDGKGRFDDNRLVHDGSSTVHQEEPASDSGARGGASHSDPVHTRRTASATVRNGVKAGAVKVSDPGNAGLGLSKIRYRWRHRHDQPRSCCCGLCGDVVGETAEQRMQRLMSRQIKAEGYTLFERFIIRVYVPVVHRARWPLLLLFLLLFILVCVFGAYIEPAGIPTTLVASDISHSAEFAELDNAFGQRGACTFCGPYYRPISEYRTATRTEATHCLEYFSGPQMNLYPDECGVCDGNNACVDCAGVPNGGHVEQCNSCELPENPSCSCANSHSCAFCDWRYNIPNAAGPNCSVVCDPSACAASGGTCNHYTGECECGATRTGESCSECAAWLLPIDANPQCNLECNALDSGEPCQCNQYTGRCTGCPDGWRGHNCSEPAKDCGPHGTYDLTGDVCQCDSGWGGDLCDASEVCSYRGTWMEADESPTGTAMCACKGHWRGPTCQLCDCLNGGMCDDDTGSCVCQGAFTGRRCQTCVGDCVAHGRCPTDVSFTHLNVRACIDERCTDSDKEAETTCSSCPAPSLRTSTCDAYSDKASCNTKGECWWNVDEGLCASATWVDSGTIVEPFACQCANDNVWAGMYCSRCLAPSGATCKDANTIVDCTGRERTSYLDAIGTDRCGICGGDGLCRGCDGVPGSGLVYDVCGICGGNDACLGMDHDTPIFADYLISIGNSANITSTEFADAVAALCVGIRATGDVAVTRSCVLEDYLASLGRYSVASVQSLYDYANATGRLAEVVFRINYGGTPIQWTYMTYRVQLRSITSSNYPLTIYEEFLSMRTTLEREHGANLRPVGVSFSLSSTALTEATAFALSKQSLWFAVGIGIAVCFVFLYVFFVSILAAAGGAAVAGVVCFGTLCVCRMFPDWKLDAVLQVCISCTIPIAVEYVVHIISGYFDYLQTTTSHLFARSATQKGAITGTMLRSVPSICTSVVAVILSSIAFDVSELVPSRRSGQVCIAMHLVLLVAIFFFSGAASAIGPSRSYQHWTLSVFICFVCGILACLAVAFISIVGVISPNGERIVYSQRRR